MRPLLLTALLLPTLALGAPAKDAPMTTEQIVSNYFAGWSGNLDAALPFLHRDYVGQTVAAGQKEVHGAEGFKAWVNGVLGVLPGSTKEVTHIAASGDQVAVHVHFSAPHPTGGPAISGEQVHWLTLKDGRVAEDRVYFDLNTVFSQLKAAE